MNTKTEVEVIRNILLALAAIVAFSSVPAAQGHDAFLGIWEFNHAKSSITRGGPPKMQTMANTAEPNGFRIVRAQVNDNGMTGVEVHYFIFDGAFHDTDGNDVRGFNAKRVDARTLDSDTQRKGVVTAMTRYQVSADGRTLTVTSSGAAGNGQRYDNDIRVYDKKP